MTAGQAFSDAEWALLCGPLQLRTAEARDSRSLPAQDLLDEAVCSDLLDALGPVIGSPTRAITASLLAKRFSFLGTGACLYSLSNTDIE